LSRLNPKQVNVVNVWEEEVAITPGVLNETGGQYAYLSLAAATEALKAGSIHGLVTAPIHKKNIQSEAFPYSGHTPYLKAFFGGGELAMLMVGENMRVALLSEHIPVGEVAAQVTQEAILKKLQVIHKSLQKDFGIDKPRIAVLGLNPHAGDEGLIGEEEKNTIQPAIKEAKRNMMVFGPYPADAFFARGQHERFDATLALYHDQGLIPFKSLVMGEGVNYTAGLPAVRTSPDHGTAFDIAGKGKADHLSLQAALFTCLDILQHRSGHADRFKNPLRKVSARMLANAVDERIEESENG
jgi:4-hydroxythreonine-4-phosphate dehydrogenase